MNEEATGKSVCATADAGDETQQELVDLSELAEKYMSESQHAQRDLATIVPETAVQMSPHDSPQRSGIDDTVLSFWNDGSPLTRNAAPSMSDVEGTTYTALSLKKAATELMDSSELDQTQERFGNHIDVQKSVKPSTDSPESILDTRTSSAAAGDATRPAGSNNTFQPADVFLPRMDVRIKIFFLQTTDADLRPQLQAEPEQREVVSERRSSSKSNNTSQCLAQSVLKMERTCREGSSGAEAVGSQGTPRGNAHQNSFSRMLGLEDDDVGREANKRNVDMWEGRGSSSFHAQPFAGLPQHASALRGGGSSGDLRGPAGRGVWGTSPDMPGLNAGGWGSGTRYAGKGNDNAPGLARRLSDGGFNNGQSRYGAYPVRRQFSEELYDAPRGSLDLLSGPGGAIDAMLGESDLGRHAQLQADLRRGHNRSKSHGMPPQHPARAAAGGAYYSPSGPVTPADRTRKRRREGPFYALADQERQQGGQPSRGRMVQDELISMLKQQIAGLDAQTKSLMKTTLYRISRNATTSADGVREASYENPRNAYLDKVVANFMYNRFSRAAISRPSYPSPGGYFNRACSSPEIAHPSAGPGLDMEQ